MDDSWERIEEDIYNAVRCDDVCGYFSHDGKSGNVRCLDCPACGTVRCECEMALDVLRRAKKLAGVE